MANEHIYYAIQSVQLRESNAGATWSQVSGVQSVGMTTTFDFDQAFQLGQIEIYADVEAIPNIEATIERNFDATETLWSRCTDTDSVSLPGKLLQKTDFALLIFPDSYTAASGAGTTIESAVACSGMYLNNYSFTLPVDGNATESVTLIGNDKEWCSGNGLWPTMGSVPAGGFGQLGAGGETAHSGIVARREHLDITSSTLPSGTGGMPVDGIDLYDHLATITVSADFGRDDKFRLGMRKPYTKIPTYPIEITSSFEVTTGRADIVDARSDVASNTTAKEIQIDLTVPYDLLLNLGTNNKLRSIDYGGGDAAGGDATVTYNFSNFNELTITGG